MTNYKIKLKAIDSLSLLVIVPYLVCFLLFVFQIVSLPRLEI